MIFEKILALLQCLSFFLLDIRIDMIMEFHDILNEFLFRGKGWFNGMIRNIFLVMLTTRRTWQDILQRRHKNSIMILFFFGWVYRIRIRYTMKKHPGVFSPYNGVLVNVFEHLYSTE
jgi:hypothetical protein